MRSAKTSFIERDHYFDNVKGALITLVVIGHFLLPMARTRLVESLINSIYLFHMPMFALVSGYFAKSVYRNGTFRTDKVLRLVWLYILFEMAVHVTENLAAGLPVTGHIDFFWEDGAPWYLLAMIWWYLSIPFMAGLNPGASLMICLFLGLAGGYQDSVGDGLAMSRTLAFAPFFYWGYYWKKEQVERFLDSRRRWMFPVLGLGIAAAAALGGRWFGKVSVIIYGVNYRRLAAEFYPWGGLLRLGCYVCGGVMLLGVMAVIPRKKRWWTFLGERTLEIYILHRLLRDMMEYWGFYRIFTSQYRRTVALVVILAVAATLVLGGPWFAWMFAQVQKVPDYLYSRWKQR